MSVSTIKIIVLYKVRYPAFNFIFVLTYFGATLSYG